ncbi:MAG TPA: hypothetical protein VF043_39875 [Ktedonobacteraceae bacterium]
MKTTTTIRTTVPNDRTHTPDLPRAVIPRYGRRPAQGLPRAIIPRHGRTKAQSLPRVTGRFKRTVARKPVAI